MKNNWIECLNTKNNERICINLNHVKTITEENDFAVFKVDNEFIHTDCKYIDLRFLVQEE
jgi:hypothetical protein